MGEHTSQPEQSLAMDEFRRELEAEIFDAYAGGALGEGWMFIGEPISKDEMKARIVHDPDKMRHLSRMQAAAWKVVERWTEADGEAGS